MKTVFFTLMVCAMCSFSSFGQDYEKVMKENIDKMYAARGASDLVGIAQLFERIGVAEKEEWLPYYYASYAFTSILFYNSDLSDSQKDEYLDCAQKYLDLSMKFAVNESENEVLQTLIHQMRIFTPARGMVYAMKANSAIDRGLTLDKTNPRLYYLKGLSILHTPKAFGGGHENALPYFEKAMTYFEAFKPQSSIVPMWGKKHTVVLLREIQVKE